ncbi:unnamed protein product [Acanthosepion pharaonis]|uniref:Uncharacterized protein n=1 Tax=Acanthosepion pharaonis TaxID=158019 RepID=A0A812DBY5_ACAPH|nr:unnamed protein product [Sepia pharaonis]
MKKHKTSFLSPQSIQSILPTKYFSVKLSFDSFSLLPKRSLHLLLYLSFHLMLYFFVLLYLSLIFFLSLSLTSSLYISSFGCMHLSISLTVYFTLFFCMFLSLFLTLSLYVFVLLYLSHILLSIYSPLLFHFFFIEFSFFLLLLSACPFHFIQESRENDLIFQTFCFFLSLNYIPSFTPPLSVLITSTHFSCIPFIKFFLSINYIFFHFTFFCFLSPFFLHSLSLLISHLFLHNHFRFILYLIHSLFSPRIYFYKILVSFNSFLLVFVFALPSNYFSFVQASPTRWHEYSFFIVQVKETQQELFHCI